MSGKRHKRASVIAIHGMGRTEHKYAEEFREALFTRLKEKAKRLHFGAIYYQDLLDPNEDRFWKATSGRLRWQWLRKFALYFLGDAAALETRKSNADSPYIFAQIAIARELCRAYSCVGAGSPVTFIAHSLGCQVLSNYLWDAQQYREKGRANVGIWSKPKDYADQISPDGILANEQLEFIGGSSVRLMYTTGCNIPMFMAGHPRAAIQAFDPVQEEFEWHNFYDKDDVLGWPLTELSDSYRYIVKDHEVNASHGLFGWLIKSWNPASHGEYWCDKEVLEHLENQLARLL